MNMFIKCQLSRTTPNNTPTTITYTDLHSMGYTRTKITWIFRSSSQMSRDWRCKQRYEIHCSCHFNRSSNKKNTPFKPSNSNFHIHIASKCCQKIQRWRHHKSIVQPWGFRTAEVPAQIIISTPFQMSPKHQRSPAVFESDPTWTKFRNRCDNFSGNNFSIETRSAHQYWY